MTNAALLAPTRSSSEKPRRSAVRGRSDLCRVSIDRCFLTYLRHSRHIWRQCGISGRWRCVNASLHDGCCRRRLGIGRRAQQHSTKKAVCSSAIGYSGVPAPQRWLAELTVCEKGYSINYLSSRWGTSAISNGNPNSQSRSKMTCEIVSQSHDMGSTGAQRQGHSPSVCANQICGKE